MHKTTKILAGVSLAALAGIALAVTGHIPADILAMLAPLKGAALAWGPLVRSLQGKHAEQIDAMNAMAAILSERDLTEDEQAKYDAAKAEVGKLKGKIEMAMEAETASAGLQRPEPAASVQPQAPARGAGSVVVQAVNSIRVTENVDSDPMRGFRSEGDFVRAVHGAAMAARQGLAIDSRLNALGGPQAAAPSTYGNEGSGADGGYLVPTQMSSRIFDLSLQEESLLSMTDQTPVEGNGMSFPKDETTPWGSNGVRAYWQSEASAGTPTKPVFGTAELKLKKLMALVPMTEELLADATALGAYFGPAAGRSIRWKADEAILYGTGAGQPLGIFNSGAFITQAKDSGQSTGTLSATNLVNMVSRLLPGSYGRSVWLINNDVLPALTTLTLGNYPIYLPAGSPIGALRQTPYGALLGRPVMMSQHAKSFSSLGDVQLIDFTHYQSIIKSGGVQTATSMHLYFDADAVAFRATFRIDGQPKLGAPVTPANGSNTLSPFVQLEAR